MTPETAGQKTPWNAWRVQIKESLMRPAQIIQPQPANTNINGRLSNLWSARKDVSLIAIFLLVVLLYALLVIRDTIPPAGLAALAGLWLLHWVLSGHLSSSTPLDMPILGLFALLPLSLSISVNYALTLPKIYGLLLCVAFFYVVINYFRDFKRTPLAIAAFILLALAVPVLGLLAADWAGSSFTLPARILNRLSMNIPLLGKLSTGGGIHVNTIGGTLTFFVPLLISMLWDEGALRRNFLLRFKNPGLHNSLMKLLLLVALALVLVMLVLTQSRGSYLGAGVGVLALLIWKRPRLFWLIPLIIILLVAAFLVFGQGDLRTFFSLLDTSREGDTFWVRLDYWQRTVYLIQDFPVTGVGLGTYGKVFDELYTFTPFSSQGQPAFYAHNMYLAVAASMGIPALVLFCALFSGCASMVYLTYRKVRSSVKILLIGLSCGVLANLAYGLWDNYLLGEKLALVLWVYLGLISAIFIHQERFQHHHHQNEDLTATREHSTRRGFKPWLAQVLIGVVSWVLISLLALAFVNLNAYLSLAIAALGGILLGYLLTRRFETAAVRFEPAPSV